MKFGIFTIYDCKVKEFSAPFIQREGAVERTVQEMVLKSPVPSEDLTLWQIGLWDSETGNIFNHESFISPVFVDVDFLGSLPDFDEEVEE